MCSYAPSPKISFLITILLIFIPLHLNAKERQKESVCILIDASNTSPYVDKDSGLTVRASALIGRELSNLTVGSRVSIVFFCAKPRRQLDFEIWNRKGQRAKDVASKIAATIALVPKMVERGVIKPLNSSNILFAIREAVKVTPTRLFVLSDHLEFSSLGNGYSISKGNGQLPDLGIDFKHCGFTGLGIGYGLSDERSLRLEKIWMAWLEKANADMARVRLLRHF